MGTLNVARLRHIDENRKLQAMLSAALICAELDKLADREPVGPNVDDYLTLLAQDESAGENEGDKPVTTESLSPPRSIKAQQRHLAEQLGSNDLILFMGSAKPSEAEDWPTLEDLARQLMKEIDYDSPSRDIPRKQFAIYQNRIKAGRGHLIDKLVQYFESYLPPPFFTKVADFNWHSIYTTNQHTYLEDAYERRNQAQYQVVVSPPQRMDVSADKMPIYKLYGCLSKEHRREPSTTLPITDYDHRALNTQERIQQLTSKLEQDLAAGKSLLVLYPSETELDMAFRWRQSAKGDGLVWITGADHSEEDQDHYRHLGFRVLPDDPSDLLSDFSAFVQS